MGRPILERRRRVVVDRDLQVRLVGRMAAAFLGSLLFFIAISLGAPVLLGAFAGVPDWGIDTLLFRIRFLLSFVALPLLSGVLVLFAVGIRSTFGVAGPLYRFCQVFRDLGALRIPRGVRIRKGDTLQETARLFDESLIALHDHVARIQARGRSAQAELEAALDADPLLASTLGELQRELDALDREAGRFKLLPGAPYSESALAALEDQAVVLPSPAPPPQPLLFP